MDGGQDLVRLGVRLLDLVRPGTKTTTYEPATLLTLIEGSVILDAVRGCTTSRPGPPSTAPTRQPWPSPTSTTPPTPA